VFIILSGINKKPSFFRNWASSGARTANLINPTSGDGAFDLANGLGDLDVARAGFGTVEDGVAAEDAELVAEDLQALGGALVAAVEDEAMGVNDRRRAYVLLVSPEGGAGGGAGGAQDALGSIIETLALLRALQALLPGRGVVVDQIGQHGAVVLEERLHIDDHILDDAHAKQRLNRDLFRAQVLDQHLARQAVAPVDAHGIRAAHAVGARAPERERPIQVSLDILQQIQHPVGRISFYLVGFVMGLAVLLRVEAKYLQCHLHSSSTFRKSPQEWVMGGECF